MRANANCMMLDREELRRTGNACEFEGPSSPHPPRTRAIICYREKEG